MNNFPFNTFANTVESLFRAFREVDTLATTA